MSTKSKAVDSSAYPIISRPTASTRQLLQWADIEDEAKISFDGDVAAIQALALEKALANAVSPSEEEDLAVPVTCDGTLTETVLTIRFDYIVEFDPSFDDTTSGTDSSVRRLQQEKTQIEMIVSTVEEELQAKMPALVLGCETDRPEIIEANILGLVHTPKDLALVNRKWKFF